MRIIDLSQSREEVQEAQREIGHYQTAKMLDYKLTLCDALVSILHGISFRKDTTGFSERVATCGAALLALETIGTIDNHETNSEILIGR